MRTLGIDYGDARVGIAITDALGITAQGLETIHSNGNDKVVLRKLDEIFSEYEVDTIVVGMFCAISSAWLGPDNITIGFFNSSPKTTDNLSSEPSSIPFAIQITVTLSSSITSFICLATVLTT